jgi:hypothetical protein
MRAFAIAAIITSLAVPALAQGDPAKSEANKAEDQKKKEAEEIEKAYKDMLKRTTREQPVKKTANFLCAPMSARFVTSRGLCSTSQPSDASATPWEGASLKAPHVAVPFLPHDLAPQLGPTWRAQTTLWCCVPSLVELKSSTFVNIFMICPDGRLVTRRSKSNSASNRGHLMTCRNPKARMRGADRDR